MSIHIRYTIRTIVVVVIASISIVASAATATTLVPNTAPHGARAVIAGTALDAGALNVTFAGSAPATIVSRSTTFVEIVVPSAATSGLVQVNINGTAIASLPFTLTPDAAFVKVATLAASDKAHDILKSPTAIAVMTSTGTAVVADTMHHRIVTVTPTGQVALLGGSGSPGLADGLGAQAQFNEPGGVAVDETRQIIYVADTVNNAIRAVTYNGRVSTLVGAGLKQPSGLAIDSAGTIYVADTGNDNIKAITPAGAMTTFAGGIHEGFADGAASQALFKQPAAVAVTSDGAVIVADSGNNRIRRIDHGVVSTIAGTGHDGFADGSAAVAELKQPSGVALDDAGNVFVADSGNHAIRKIANGSVSTVAGTGTNGFVDGAPSTAQFKQPGGIAFAGALFVADSGNDAIRILDPQLALAAIDPKSGDPLGGQRVRIFGSGFVPGPTTVMFGGAAATDVTFITSTELVVTTPAHALGLVDVTVTTSRATAMLANAFTFAPPPTIATINPIKGPTAGGQTLTVTGTNFLPDTTVTLGGFPAPSVSVLNSSSLTFTTPAAPAGPAGLVVTTSAGSATRSAAYTYFAPPTITSFSPAQGGAGTAVTISGTNFDADPAGDAVTVAGTSAQVSAATPSQLTIVIPAGASNGPIAVTTAGGTAMSATDFTTSATFKISAPALTLTEGAAVPFAATSGTSDVTLQASWSSSNASIVSIASNGMATGRTAGMATITATYNGQTASQDVRVEATTIPTLAPPPLDAVAPQSPADSIRFLYSGAGSVQSGVAPNTIDDRLATALRGSVHDRNGVPLAGVRITVSGHPELGQTFTRADGVFDLAVNGGGVLTLTYTKGGFITAERTLQTNALDEENVDDVVLIGYDGQANGIASGAGSAQVARGSVVTDSSGTRRATIFFPPSTSLSMQTPSGNVPLLFATVRATEFSVGPNGPKAMPAALPRQSAYTYCVELSVDEAIAAGATTVEFSNPVSVYIENFLGFSAGMQVPLAFYDRTKSAWIPSDDGRVVRITAIVNGLASVDTSGTGSDDIGLSVAERQQLASHYGAGTLLWRLTTTHFSTIDANFPSLSVNATVPTGQATWYPAATCPYTLPGNSTIECENQTLGEAVPVTGTPFALHYQSDRTPGRVASRTIDVPVIGATVPPGLLRIDLEITVAGNTTRQSFPPAPNQSYRYTWDGLDRFGRPLIGGAPAFVRTSYAFDGVYEMPVRVSASFGLASGQRTNIGTRIEVSATQLQQGVLGSWTATADRLGGWSISPHHAYDPASHTLYRGDGTRQSDTPQRFGITTGILTTVAGSTLRDPRWLGAGGPATAAQIDSIEAMAFAPDGSLYLSSQSFIHKVTPQGTLVRVAGDYPGLWSDPADLFQGSQGGPVNFFHPRGMAFGPDGSLYVAEPYFNIVRRFAPDGQDSVFAGVPTQCFACFVDNVPALQARLNFPRDVAVAPDGSVYILDGTNQRVRRVSPDGIIRTVAGNGQRGQDFGGTGPNGDGGPAVAATLAAMNAIGLGPDGSLYIAEVFRVRRVGPDGIITTVAGNGNPGASGDGGPATAATIEIGQIGGDGLPKVFSVAADGSLYFVNNVLGSDNATIIDSRIRRVDPKGIITTVVGTGPVPGSTDITADGAFATASDTRLIDTMTTSADGRPYFAGVLVPSVRALVPSMPSFGSSEITIADGSLVHVFTPKGQHLRTVDADTGAVLYTFGYTSDLLTTITDVAGNVTTVERDGSGDAMAIVASGGQRTEISGAPYATSITTAPGETTQFSYSADGLMTGKIDPRNVPSTFTWSSLGLLIRDAGADGGAVDGDRTEINDGHTVVMTTAGGRITRYSIAAPPNGDETRTTIDPVGLLTTTVRHPDQTAVTTLPDGSTVTTKEDPDPLWSTQAPFTSSLTLQLPSGRRFTTTTSRSASLTNPADPLSVSSRTDSVTINGNTFNRYFDRDSLTDTLVSPMNRASTLTRDTAGRLVDWSMPTITDVAMSYDGRGRLQSITQGTRQQTFGYDTRNELTSVTDALNRTVGFAYDAAGRLTTQTLPDLRQIHFTYDANGNLTSVTPPSRPVHAFSFTARNLVDTYTPPDDTPGGPTTYRYNVDRQLTLITRPDAQSIALDYDTAGRLGTITTSAATLGYGYDSAGRLASVSNSNGVSLGYGYDGPLLTQQQWSGAVAGSVGFTYDNDLRLGSESVNGASTIAFGYDRDGLLTSAGALALARDGFTGLVTDSTLANLTDAWSYNEFGEPSSYTATFAGSDFFSEVMTRDDAGRITAKTDTYFGAPTSVTYSYDPAGRLQTVTNSSTVTTYSYDDNGNRVSKTAPSVSESGTYDAQDRLLTYNGATYSYNANGDLTQKTDASGTTSYTYDTLGNLRTVHLPDGRVIDYVIDAQNRRVGKKINGVLVKGWLYSDQLHIAAELDGTGAVVSQFIYASRSNVPDYMTKGGVTYRIVSDHLGSPRVVIDANTGVVAWNNSYDEFGNPVPGTPEFLPFGFAGGLYDADTKLVRFGARDYDPSTARWTTKDPIGFSGGDANLYGYVLGDPVNLVDPSGLVTSVVVFYNGVAWHSALSIDSTNGEDPLLYDPSGGYEPPSGVPPGSGRVFYGQDANLDDYIAWHQTKDSSWTIFNFDTTPAEERVLRRRVEEQGGGGAFDCAQNVSTVLSGVGRFKRINPTRFPGILARQLRNLLLHQTP